MKTNVWKTFEAPECRIGGETYTYSEMMEALGEIFAIPSRAVWRFRHLRALGCPRNVPRPGSGIKIEYSLKQVRELAFAMQLNRSGMATSLAAEVAAKIADAVEDYTEWALKQGVFAMIEYGDVRLGYLPDLVPKNVMTVQLLNVSGLCHSIEQALPLK